jgi:hypothetical protein
MPIMLVIGLLLAALLVTRPLLAGEGHPKIIAVLERANAGFLPRLRGELTSAGFDLVVVSPPSWPPTRQEIERIARDEGAIAGLSLVRAGTGVEMWVVDRVTSKTVFREVIAGTDDRDDSIAIRFVETLRATLIEIEQPRSRPGELAPPPEVNVLLTRAPSRFSVSLAGGPGYSPGGVGTTGHLGLSFIGAIHPRFGLALDGFLTPARTKVRGDEGQASIGLFLVGASFRFCPVNPSGLVRLWLGAGAWVGVMTMTGEAVAPYVNTRASSTSVIPHLDVAIRFSLTRRLSLGAGLAGGISVPSVAVQFDEHQVATWGRPLGLGSIALETSID